MICQDNPLALHTLDPSSPVASGANLRRDGPATQWRRPMATVELPRVGDDLFSRAAVLDARAVDDRLRELAPVVWLDRENIAMLGRFEHVSAGLRDWETFSSTSRPWHDPNSVRPEILLTDDPPRHTQVRTILGSALS